MPYIGSSDVTHSGNAPTRVHRNGDAAAYPRPKTRASNLARFFWFAAISQDPFARMFCMPAPLAGRHSPASPLPAIAGLSQHTLRASLSFAGLRLSVGVFSRFKKPGE